MLCIIMVIEFPLLPRVIKYQISTSNGLNYRKLKKIIANN